jgi:hypothetical protein
MSRGSYARYAGSIQTLPLVPQACAWGYLLCARYAGSIQTRVHRSPKTLPLVPQAYAWGNRLRARYAGSLAARHLSEVAQCRVSGQVLRVVGH